MGKCVHCGVELTVEIGGGLYQHANHLQRCQSHAVPYGHMGHPLMPCPPGDINPCAGHLEKQCEHLSADSGEAGA